MGSARNEGRELWDKDEKQRPGIVEMSWNCVCGHGKKQESRELLHEGKH